MIAQSLSQKQYAGSNFKSLAAYALKLGPGYPKDPLKWTPNHEAVAWAKAINCVGPHLGWSVKEIDYTQRLNIQATTCKSYHYVVSFPEGEQPSREVLENIEIVLSAAIGYRDHQRLVAAHRDTPNLHFHVAINRVHPETLKCIGAYRDHYILQRTTAELEAIHGLTTENHTPFTRTTPRAPFRPSWQVKEAWQEKVIDQDLFDRYKQEAAKAKEQREAAMQALWEKHKTYAQELAQWHKQRRLNAQQAYLNRGDRLSTFRHLKEVADKDRAERKAREKAEKEALRQQYPLLGSFEDFRAASAEERPSPSHLHDAPTPDYSLHFSERSLHSRSGTSRSRG